MREQAGEGGGLQSPSPHFHSRHWPGCSAAAFSSNLRLKLGGASEDTNVLRLLLLLQPGVRPGAPSTLPLLGVSLKLDCSSYHLCEIQYQTNLAHEGKRVVIAYGNDW